MRSPSRFEYAGHHLDNCPGDPDNCPRDLDNCPRDLDDCPGGLDDCPGHFSDGSDDVSNGSDDFDSCSSGAPQRPADAESNGNDSDVAQHLTQ